MARMRKTEFMELAIDMTPIIDCVFLLLIFLMCVTEITKTENDQRLVLPYASKATDDLDPKERVVINVFPQKGKIFELNNGTGPQDAMVTVGGEPMTWGELQNYLERRAKTAEKSPSGAAGGREVVNLPVKIRAHRTTPFQYVQFAMVYCIDMAYWKVSFGTYNREDFKYAAPFFFNGEGVEGSWHPPEIERIFN
jgi:biopolymer transport protein ExbD